MRPYILLAVASVISSENSPSLWMHFRLTYGTLSSSMRSGPISTVESLVMIKSLIGHLRVLDYASKHKNYDIIIA